MDRSTFDRLVLDHLESVHRFAIRLTGRADTAEELMQDAMVKAIRSWRTFEGRSRFSTWLMRIVINTHRDHRSRNAPPAASLESTDPPADTRPDPARLMESGDTARIIAQKISGLPLRQREVLVLTVYEQMDAHEVAATLGMSEQNVRTTLHYARQKLKEALADQMGQRTP